ncbi:MAG: hypothetical protein ACP5IO_02065 [Elusimicrobiales bacterium]
MSDELKEIIDKLKEETSKDFLKSKMFVDDKKVDSYQKDRATSLVKHSFDTDIVKKNLSRFNVVWSENKETLIFFMILSVIVIFAGLISGLEYITFAGVASFLLSAAIIFITFYRYVITASSKVLLPNDLVDRVNELENKVSYIMKKNVSNSGDNERIIEELNEIKSVVKILMSEKDLR